MLEAQSEWTVRTPGGPILLNGEQTDYYTALAALNPIAWYHLGEGSGTTMVDAMSAAHNGTYTNSPNVNYSSSVLYPGGKATRFDGSNDYASIPYAAAMDAQEWTWLMWITPEDLTAAGSFVKTILADASKAHVHIYIQNEILYVAMNPAGSDPLIIDAGAILSDQHYQLAVATDGYNVYVYRNGDLTNVERYEGVFPRGSGAWELTHGATSNNYLHCAIDDLAYFDSVLTIADITRVYAVVTDPQSASFLMTDAPDVDIPVRTTMDVYPLADGGLIDDEQYADPARWNLSGKLVATSDSDLQQDSQRWRGRLNSLKHGAGLLMWTPSGYPPLQTTIRRGERPDAGKDTPLTKNLIADLIAPDPRVYSQAEVTTLVDLTDLDGGFTSPFVGPIVEAAPDIADAAIIVNDGDEYTPPIIELDGPFGRSILTREHTYNGTTTVQQMILESNLEEGSTLTIDVARGRIYTGTEYNAASNHYDDLQDGSILWTIGPGTNYVTCQMDGSGSDSTCKVTHRHAYLP